MGRAQRASSIAWPGNRDGAITAIASRQPWRVVAGGLVVVGIGLLPALCGCGRATGGQPAAGGGKRPMLPVVITPPRPFRTAMLAGSAGQPAISKPIATSTPATAMFAEPRRFPGVPPAIRPAAAEIGTMLRDYTSAFNRRDAVALAAHWSPSAENVDLDSGDVTRGRAAVEEVFSTLFRTDGSGKLDIDIESIRLLRDDVAVVDAVSAVSFVARDPGSAPAPSRRRLSAVVVRRDDRWLLESVRESQVAGAPAAAEQPPLESLAWMVGTWEGQVAGATVRTHCHWAAGRRFLVRQHVVAAAADTTPPTSGDRGIPGLLLPGSAGSREVSEVIAFDSDRGQIRSWFFNSQGRFAEGTWAREGDRFVVSVEGRGNDSGTTCRCRIERIGPAESMTACDNEALVDLCPPACGAVRLE